MEPNKKETIHRVGTITCGTVLIVTGILFLLHIIFPVISYLFIFRLWPCILILLGAEILIGNCKKGSQPYNILFVVYRASRWTNCRRPGHNPDPLLPPAIAQRAHM